LAKP